MPGQRASDELRLDHRCVPVGERVDLCAPVHGFDNGHRGPCRGLRPLAPGDPGRERLQRLLKRLNLAERAAGIGVEGVQDTVRIAGSQRAG